MPLDDEPVLRVEQAELNAWAKARKLTALQVRAFYKQTGSVST